MDDFESIPEIWLSTVGTDNRGRFGQLVSMQRYELCLSKINLNLGVVVY